MRPLALLALLLAATMGQRCGAPPPPNLWTGECPASNVADEVYRVRVRWPVSPGDWFVTPRLYDPKSCEVLPVDPALRVEARCERYRRERWQPDEVLSVLPWREAVGMDAAEWASVCPGGGE